MRFQRLAINSALIAALAGAPVISGCANKTAIEQRLSQVPYNASELDYEAFKQEFQVAYPDVKEKYIDSIYQVYSKEIDSEDLKREGIEKRELSDIEKKIIQERFQWINFNNLSETDETMVSLISVILAFEYAPSSSLH